MEHKMKPTDDLNIRGYFNIMEPQILKQELPVSNKANATIVFGRESVQKILLKKDPRLLLVAGPCSIHDEKAAFDYADRLRSLADKVKDAMFVVMRVYFEKPRTTVGWKGLINDPNLDDTCDIEMGLRKARKILLEINEKGMPAGTEMLETITPQYVADLVSWAAIGARTTESQTHREMASGLSMSVGFKNGTDGNLDTAINAMVAARTPQTFLGIDQHGHCSIVRTNGNPWVHIVLRGGKRPNYDPVCLDEAQQSLKQKNLPEAIMVDCSHANSGKKFQRQEIAWKNLMDQRIAGNDSLIGFMLESNLFEGSQKFAGDKSSLAYGVSITDECISWETTERLVLSASEQLAKVI
jgi:3-deoxy-7-phosphoheptulonate synthase